MICIIVVELPFQFVAHAGGADAVPRAALKGAKVMSMPERPGDDAGHGDEGEGTSDGPVEPEMVGLDVTDGRLGPVEERHGEKRLRSGGSVR
jgi:hypothetical protein